jgi:hypothetical protein
MITNKEDTVQQLLFGATAERILEVKRIVDEPYEAGVSWLHGEFPEQVTKRMKWDSFNGFNDALKCEMTLVAWKGNRTAHVSIRLVAIDRDPRSTLIVALLELDALLDPHRGQIPAVKKS